MRSTRLLPVLLAAALLAGACDGGEPQPEPSPTAEMAVQVASYDLAADRPQRVMVGLVAPDGRVISYGTVTLSFSFLGRQQATGAPEPGPRAEATFLPIPGVQQPAGPADGPVLTAASESRGVYVAEGVAFGRAGIWQVDVTAEIAGGETLEAASQFGVQEEPQVPAPGDTAPRTKNHLPGEEGVDLVSVDSAAGPAGKLPDPHLHRSTIAAAIAAGRPALVIFSTPVYCVSRFCGPVTAVIAQLAREHQGDAAFIHVEVWKDFQGQVMNRAAADWIGDPTQGEVVQEPWLFLIGRDGTILQRWDNVFDPLEVVEALGDATQR